MIKIPEPIEPIWVIEEGQEVASHLDEIARKHGYHAGIIGSVAVKGFSHKDLDIVLLPLEDDSCTELTTIALQYYLEGNGAKLSGDYPGSTRYIYKWQYENKPVDIFLYPFGGE